MKIYVAYVWEYGEGGYEALLKDYRVNVYEDELAFCLENDKLSLQEQYGLYFMSANDVLFEIMLNGRQSFYDLDLQFNDLINNYDISPIMFYYKFNRIFDDIQIMFDDLFWWNVENHEEVRDNYFGLLCKIGERNY